jgi:hypothetical protein
MKKYLVFVTAAFLGACSTTKQFDVESAILGSWEFTHNSRCHEVYTFAAQGLLVTKHGDQINQGKYVLTAVPNEHGRYKIDGVDLTSKGLGCNGKSHNSLNVAYSFYVQFHPNYPDQMVINYEASSPDGFGPLNRVAKP